MGTAVPARVVLDESQAEREYGIRVLSLSTVGKMKVVKVEVRFPLGSSPHNHELVVFGKNDGWGQDYYFNILLGNKTIRVLLNPGR